MLSRICGYARKSAHKYRYNRKCGNYTHIARVTHKCRYICKRAAFFFKNQRQATVIKHVAPIVSSAIHYCCDYCTTTVTAIILPGSMIDSGDVRSAANSPRGLPKGYRKAPWRNRVAESPKYGLKAPYRSNVSGKGGRYWSGRSLVCGQTTRRFSPAWRVPLWSGCLLIPLQWKGRAASLRHNSDFNNMLICKTRDANTVCPEFKVLARTCLNG